jgi:hypothetical protein
MSTRWYSMVLRISIRFEVGRLTKTRIKLCSPLECNLIDQHTMKLRYEVMGEWRVKKFNGIKSYLVQ